MDAPEESTSLVPLIEEIRSRPVEGAAKTGSLALINLVPFAGGAVAAVIHDFATNRSFEKVCDVLAHLNSRLEAADADPEAHLSKDQIIEVVYETLQTATTASDQEKIEALKNGLGYAFLSPDPFERKQIYLQVLRPTTSLELRLLALVYDRADPHLVKLGGQSTGVGDLTTTAGHLMATAGSWEPLESKTDCGRGTLLEELAEDVSVRKGDLEGAARLLDGKGLTTLGPNLDRSDCKVLKWQQAGSSFAVVPNALLINQIHDTPLEASRTDFGKAFLDFCRGE